jgi:cytoskeleton protein RodZ
MSEPGQVSIGQTLRNAREAQGIGLDDAAVRLRLMQRQIEAMETDDFESLGQPVFARGFVRNYARLLGLDAEDLLARMKGAPEEPPAIAHVEPPLPRSWLTSPWLILFLLGLLLLTAVPVGLYLWLNSETDEAPGNRAVAQSRSTPAPDRASPDNVPPPQPAPPPAVEPAAAPVEPARAETPEVEATAASGSVVHLQFGGDAWVEIKDASGRMLHSQLNPAGSAADIRGQPPFDMVIGNAAKVQMSYNGRPIDLKPFIDVKVARFTLEE